MNKGKGGVRAVPCQESSSVAFAFVFFGCFCREVFVTHRERVQIPKRERKRKGAEK